MADVFISYKREDRAWAERVDAALREAGYTTWWDTSLVAGEQFNAAIERELDAAKCVVVLWSRAAQASRWVQAEAIKGFERGILVGAALETVVLGYPFGIEQTTPVRRQEDVVSLVDGVRAKVTGEAPQFSQQIRRQSFGKWLGTLHGFRPLRWWALGAASALVAIANVLGSAGFIGAIVATPLFAAVIFLAAKALDRGMGRVAGAFTSIVAVGLALWGAFGVWFAIIWPHFPDPLSPRGITSVVAAAVTVFGGSAILGRMLRSISWT